MYSFERFVNSKWSLVVLSDGRTVFKSQATALKPLVNYVKRYHGQHHEVVIYDKYVGRAAALLMTLVRPRAVFTPVISEGGRTVLDQYGVSFQAQREVKYLMGVASGEMCRWEKMSLGKSPDEFLRILTET